MISVLDLLRHRLGSAGQYGVPGSGLDYEGEGSPIRPDLPEVVRRSIYGRPSYGEGEIMAPRPWYNPAIDAETMLPLGSPQRRENRLMDELGLNRYLRREGQFALPEGEWLARPDRGFADPLPSPLNQMMRRGPFALY